MAATTTDMAWRLRRFVNRFGLDVVPYRPTRHPIARRLSLFARYGIDLIVDVGANGGQYGHFLRRIGYSGRIVSFEPLSSAFRDLTAAAAHDPGWDVHQMALGDRTGTATINVAGNSESSSFLPMLPAHLTAYPESRYVGSEEVAMGTLEQVIEDLPSGCRPFVKIDTQGYERTVIAGAGKAIQRVAGIQLEMSLLPLYEGEASLPEVVGLMSQLGFVLMGVDPAASDPNTGQLLQMDGIFFRSAVTG